MELLAYSHVRPVGRIVAAGRRLSLRLVLASTSVLRAGGVSLATNPEEPDELDIRLGLDGAHDGSVACTASHGRWRFAVGNVPFDVEPGRPVFVAATDWSRAMIEVARDGRAEWLAPPRIFPHAYLATERSMEALSLSPARIDLDLQQARLRTVWRCERALRPRELLGRVVVLTDLAETPLPVAEIQRRTGHLAAESALFRSVAENVEVTEGDDRTGTLAFDVPSEAAALPFQAQVPASPISAPSVPPVPPTPAPPVDRLTLGQRLAHQPGTGATPPTEVASREPDEPAATRPAAAPRVLWAERDVARRVRMHSGLRELWPRVRRAELADASGAPSIEVQERVQRELGQLLRDARPTSLATLAADASRVDDAGAHLAVVCGWLTPDLDEVATLRAVVAASAGVRREHTAVEEAAKRAEVLLASGGLDDLPSLARDAGRGVLDALRDVRADLAETVRAAAEAGLVRGRKYARRELDGETFVRATLQEVGVPARTVAYLRVAGAEKLPLLRRVAVVVLVSSGPAMEEGDPGPVAWIHALGRDTRA